MTDQEYIQLQHFIEQYIKDSKDKEVAYKFINELDRMNIIHCEQCMFHLDCNIEKLLPGFTDSKFCSYGKMRGLN